MFRSFPLLFVLLFVSVGAITPVQSAELFVDSAARYEGEPDGSRQRPFSTLHDARDHARLLRRASSSEVPVTITVQPGRYRVSKTLRLSAVDSGTALAPMIIRSAEPHAAILDGALELSASSFRLVTKDASLGRLNKLARGSVHSTVVSDPALLKVLRSRSSRAMLMQDGRVLMLARFPNIGFAHARDLLVADEGTRWQSDPVKGTHDSPNGALFTLRESPSATWQQWTDEIKHSRRVYATGYISAQWYRETMPIASTTADGKIQYMTQSRYGLEEMVDRFQSRLSVRNLLCELDQPGEWYFDTDNNELFVWPVVDLADANASLLVAASNKAIDIVDAKHVRVEGFTIEGVASDCAVALGGEDNVLAGCVIRNCDVRAVNVSGNRNRMQSCDVYDVRSFALLGGGKTHRDNIADGENEIVNCHFFMDQLTGSTASVGITGAGNRFANNLMHNLPGQAVTFKGNNHMIERNELFNIGFEEGDGATIYSGAQFWGYGSTIQHNFLHHIMSTDGLMTRSGIMLDDHDSGRSVIGNIFYKAGYGSLAVNGGTGLTIHDNIFIKGHQGVWVRVIGDINKLIEMKTKFDSGDLPRGDKHDYVWRTEQVVGEKGWNDPYWKETFPTFAKVMNQDETNHHLRFYPIELDVQNTIAYQMSEGPTYLSPKAPKQIGWEFRGTRELSAPEFQSAFVDPDRLDFRPRQPKPDWMPTIPFDSIGLQKDAYRESTPDQPTYRSMVREHFKGRPSCNRRAKYDFDRVNETIYWNSGAALRALSP